MMSKTDVEIFKYGSDWVRADFHLHTKADSREFSYSGDDNYFVTNYINRLKETGIRIGLISNQNKFDFSEFRDLLKNAKKEEISWQIQSIMDSRAQALISN